MRVGITTDGGFTGRGIGSATADVEESFLSRCDIENWKDEYRTRRGADLVRYTLTVGDRAVSWTEGAEIPDDLRALFEKVWG